ncbi:MAG: hypothetical protein ACFFE4_04080 [Candidatus Thorarchaeota archaeon]
MTIKKINNGLSDRNLNKKDTVESIIYLLEKGEGENLLIRSINSLIELDIKSDRIYKILEEYTISGYQKKVREAAIKAIVSIFKKKPPKKLFEWLIKKETNISILKSIIYSFQKVDEKYSFYLEKQLLFRYSKLYNLITEEAQFFWDVEKNLSYKEENMVLRKRLIEIPYTFNILSDLPKNFLPNTYKPLYSIKNGRVHFLNLSGYGLNSIPDSIKILSSLKYLNLSFNKLENLPDSVSLLPNLRYLNISHNNFKEIPESVALFSRLKYFNVSFNPLKRISKSLLKLAKEKFSNYYIWLGVVPSEALVLGLLEMLSGFKLSKLEAKKEINFNHEFHNSFKINDQGHITGLSMYDNKLNMPIISFIPDQICELKHLEIFIIPVDRTEIIPDCIRNLTFFEEIDHRYINR